MLAYERPVLATRNKCGKFRRSTVALIRSWVRSGVVSSLNHVAAELDRPHHPTTKGQEGQAAEYCRRDAAAGGAKSACQARASLAVLSDVLELARRLTVGRKQTYHAVEHGARSAVAGSAARLSFLPMSSSALFVRSENLSESIR